MMAFTLIEDLTKMCLAADNCNSEEDKLLQIDLTKGIVRLIWHKL